MKKLLYLPIVLLFCAFSCKKKSQEPAACPLPVAEKQDSIYFVFINKIGYKNDSVNAGNGNKRYFFAVDLESGYYNSKTDKSELRDVVYGRFSSGILQLKDSIMHRAYPCYVNSQANLIVYLAWNNINGNVITRFRDLTYQLNIKGNDTIKTTGNKIIKFTWPDDTISGKFVKTWDSLEH